MQEKILCKMRDVKISKSHKISFTKEMAKVLDLGRDTILLMRFSNNRAIEWVSKVTQSKYGYNFRLGERALKEYGIREGDILDIEIVQKKDLERYVKLKMSNDIVDITSFMITGSFGFFEKQGDRILIYSRPHSCFLMRRNIDLDKWLFWLIGFYLAEGNMTSNVFGVSNTDQFLLQLFKNKLEEKLGISKDLWRVEVFANKRKSELRIKGYWSNNLSIDAGRIKVYFKKMKINSDYGVARLALQRSMPLLKIWLNMCNNEEMRKIVLSNRERMLYFLRGFEAGDGYVSSYTSKNGWNNLEVGIQQKKNNEIICFIYKLYDILYGEAKIQQTKTKGTKVYFNNCSKIRELIIDKHFSEQESQRTKLIKGYLRMKLGKKDMMYLTSLDNSSLDEIAKKLGLRACSVHERLIRMIFLDLIDRRKINEKFRYFLTNKGKYFLKCLLSVGEANDQNILHKNLRMHGEQVGLEHNRRIIGAVRLQTNLA